MSFSELGILATGLYDFEGIREDNLSFKKGEVITIIEMDESGWWRGANAEGKIGIFPYNYVQARNLEDEGDKQYRLVRAIADCFEVPNDDYLQFKAGDLITVLKPFNEDWSIGLIHADPEDPTSVAREGRFPLNFVEETGMKDEYASKEESEKYEQLEKEKRLEAERLQKERLAKEKELAELERLQKEQEAEDERLRQKELAKAKAKAAEEKEKEKQLAMAKEKEVKLEKEKREAEAELEKQKQETLAKDMLNSLQQALAEQEAALKAMKEQKEQLELAEKQRKSALLLLQQEAEEAKQRAMKAEQELVIARTEQERLKKLQQEQDAKKSEQVKLEVERQKLSIANKANKSYQRFTDENGFSSPPALEQMDENTNYGKMNRNNKAEERVTKLNFELESLTTLPVLSNMQDLNDEVEYEAANDNSNNKNNKNNSRTSSVTQQTPKLTAQETLELARSNFTSMLNPTTSNSNDNNENAENNNNQGRRKKVNKLPAKFANLGSANNSNKCPKCGKIVGFGPESFRALNKVYHKECFTCKTCEKVLRNGEYVDNKGEPYCLRCHKAGFGIKGFGFGGVVAGNYV